MASTFSPQKRWGGAYTLDATAVTALTAVTTATTVSEVLDLLSAVTKRQHPVSSTGIGKATVS